MIIVSVIIPNFNHSLYLNDRINSVLMQTFQDFEVIILDDCSTDASRDVIESFRNHPKVKLIEYNTNNSGSTFKQWQKGLDLATGKFIWIAESDDTCAHNFLEEAIQPLLIDDEIALSYTQSNRMDANGNITGNWLNHTDTFTENIFNTDFIYDGNLFIENYLLKKNVIPNASAVVFRKSFLKHSSYLDKEVFLKYNGDWMFYVQLIINHKIAFNSKALNNFRFHSKSVIAKANNQQNEMYLADLFILMQKKLLNFIVSQNPSNINNIKAKSKQNINELYYSKAYYYVKNKNWLHAITTLSKIPIYFIKRYFFK